MIEPRLGLGLCPSSVFLSHYHISLSLSVHAQGISRWDNEKWFFINFSSEETLRMKFMSLKGLFYPKVLQFSSVAQSCPTLCIPMNRSTPGLPVHHQLPEFTQTHSHRVSDTIQSFHPLSSHLLLPPIPPSIRVFSNESTLHMRWPKYRSSESTHLLKGNKNTPFAFSTSVPSLRAGLHSDSGLT